MKNLGEYLNEKLVINKSYKTVRLTQEQELLYNKFDFIGNIPSKQIANAICWVAFGAPDNNNTPVFPNYYEFDKFPKVKLNFDEDTKTIKFDNVVAIAGTIKKLYKLFEALADYTIIFPDELDVYIRTGLDMTSRKYWPNLEHCGNNYPCAWYDILDYIVKDNSKIKINKLELERFDGNCRLKCDIFNKIYVEQIHFSQCKYERNLELPDNDERRRWKNPNLKLTSDSKMAEKYYKENGF